MSAGRACTSKAASRRTNPTGAVGSESCPVPESFTRSSRQVAVLERPASCDCPTAGELALPEAVLAARPLLPARFLVLGSASSDLLRQSSESLAMGRERRQAGRQVAEGLYRRPWGLAHADGRRIRSGLDAPSESWSELGGVATGRRQCTKPRPMPSRRVSSKPGGWRPASALAASERPLPSGTASAALM